MTTCDDLLRQKTLDWPTLDDVLRQETLELQPTCTVRTGPVECKCDCPDAELFAHTVADHYSGRHEELFDKHDTDNALEFTQRDGLQSRIPTRLYFPFDDDHLGELGKDATDDERIANKKNAR